MRDYLEAIRKGVVVYDGGMGATLEQFELTQEDYGGLQGKCHEALVLHRPDVIQGVHESMLAAGANVLETDTFQGSRIKLGEWGLADHTPEINQKAAEIARKAAGESRFVAGSLGPTGHLPASNDPTLGKITFGELREVFAEQAGGLLQGGADLIIIETAQDILEVKAAVFGARDAMQETGRVVPIHTSVSLLPNGGKMLLGTDISAVLTILSALEVDVIGLNCSTGPEDMRDAIRYLGENSPVPVACIPNAGLPLQGPNGETIFPEEAEQMRQVVKRVALTQPAPLQIDSTEPDVIQAALEQNPGRAIVNSINLEAGRDKADRIVPLAKQHGAALIALTIDEEGMAKTVERKVEIAKRIHDICVDDHGLDPELLIFDLLTFTLTTGSEEWIDSAVQTIEGIRALKTALPAVKTSLGVSNVSFGVKPNARAVLNSVFLHHCVEAGLDLAMVNPNHITPYPEISENERALADDLVFNRRPDALQQFVEHFEGKSEEAEDAEDPTEGMEPEQALHWHILRRKKDGVEDWIDRSVDKIGAVPTLNEVLLPAMKEVGDKFGAGELILPFVLQSAEVMKRCVAQLEKYLEKLERHTKGTVVIATVFGDVHDIGKSLVNTILTNNGYTVIDLGKQVPIDTIINAAVEHKATAIGLSALLVSTSKQMPICVSELHERGLEFPVRVGGAAINRDFGRRILYPKGKESDEIYVPGVFYCKDAFEGLDTMDKLIDADARSALVEKIRAEAKTLREKPLVVEDLAPTTDASVRSKALTDVPIPVPPFWGAREIPVDFDELFPHLDRHVLFKLHWGGQGVKGDAWRKLVREDFQPRLERMWAQQKTDEAFIKPRALLGYFPCNSDGNDIVVWNPEDLTEILTRLTCPRQPKNDRICLADFFRPIDSGERDVVALQAVTAGPEATELGEKLEAEGEYSERYFVHGLSVQAAEGLAEWLHQKVRADLGLGTHRGRRYSWGYPAMPEQSEHEKVQQVLHMDQIGIALSGGYALTPEQSTVALVAHHPQAVYFGTTAGRIREPGAEPDEVIALSDKGGPLPDSEPETGDDTEADMSGAAAATR